MIDNNDYIPVDEDVNEQNRQTWQKNVYCVYLFLHCKLIYVIL